MDASPAPGVLVGSRLRALRPWSGSDDDADDRQRCDLVAQRTSVSSILQSGKPSALSDDVTRCPAAAGRTPPSRPRNTRRSRAPADPALRSGPVGSVSALRAHEARPRSRLRGARRARGQSVPGSRRDEIAGQPIQAGSSSQLCRRPPLSLDRLPGNHLAVTQEQIAHMLGVRREGVTEAALSLQRAGLISYRRGQITVLDRLGLEKTKPSVTRS